MKNKIYLFLFALLLGFTKVNAQKANLTAAKGWTQITELPAAGEINKYFFAIYDHTQDLGMVLGQGVYQGGEFKTMWYRTDANPESDHAALWTMEDNQDGETHYKIVTNVAMPTHFLQTEYGAAYFYRTHDNGGGALNWGRTIPIYDSGSWTIQNGVYPANGYLGPWDGAFADGAEVALNKDGGNVGQFDIYQISKGRYVQNAVAALAENATADITYVLTNPDVEAPNRGMWGWTVEGAFWTQGSNAFNKKSGNTFVEAWEANNLGNRQFYQGLTNMPAGKYTLKVLTGVEASGAKLFINGVETELNTKDVNGVATVTAVVTNGTLRVGIKLEGYLDQWVYFDRFQLYYTKYTETPATSLETSTGSNDYNDYFYVIRAHSTDLNLVLQNGAHQGAGNKAMWYSGNADPKTHKNALWTMVDYVQDATHYKVLSNAAEPGFMLQTEGNAGHLYHTSDNGGNGDLGWGRVSPVYDSGNGYWTIQNGVYPEAGYLGRWDDGQAPADGTETALNKGGGDIGHFDIFKIKRGKYVEDVESEKAQTQPVDISYILTNADATRRSMVGWAMENTGALSNGYIFQTQNNGGLANADNGWFFEAWQPNGNLSNRTMSQTFTDMPDGQYTLTVRTDATVAGAKLFINNVETDLSTNTDGVAAVIANVTGGTLSIGVKLDGYGSNWIKFDMFQLIYSNIVSTLPTTEADLNNYFFVFRDFTRDLALVLGDGTAGKQGTGKKTMFYSSDTNPVTNKLALWTIAKSGTNTLITSPNHPNLMLETVSGSAQYYRTVNNGDGDVEGDGNSDLSLGNAIFAYNASTGWTIQNGKAGGSNYLGPWTNASFINGAEIGFNKNGANMGHFAITKMSRGQYVADAETEKAKTGPVDISYILTNAGAERDAATRTDGMIGWTMEPATSNSTDNFKFQAWGGDAMQSIRHDKWCFGAWSPDGTTLSDRQMYQEFTDMPAGLYMLSVIADATATGAKLFIEDSNGIVETDFSQKNGTANTVSVALNTSGGTIRFGVKLEDFGARTIQFDHFQLFYLNPQVPVHRSKNGVADNTDYYLMNVATGKFLGADNNDGTEATIVEHGMPFRIEPVEGDAGKYQLNSYTYQAESSHYLNYWNDRVNVDGTLNENTKFTLADQGDGKFTITEITSNCLLTSRLLMGETRVDLRGTQNNNPASQWYLISKADRERNLVDGYTEGDATFYIPNASFNNRQQTTWNTKKWKITAWNNNLSDGTNVAESWHSTFHVWKTITLPNGTYRMRAQGFYRQDGSDNDNLPVFYAKTTGDEYTVAFPSRTGSENGMNTAHEAFLSGKYYSDYIEFTVTDNILTVGARLEWNKTLWCCWDNFELQLVNSNAGRDEGADDVALAHIAAMEGNLGFQEDQWAPYVVTPLKDIVNNSIDTGFPYSYNNINAYLNPANWQNTEEVNAIYRGDFSDYRNWDVINTNYRALATGWSVDNIENSGVLGLSRTEPIKENTENIGLGGLVSKKAMLIKVADTYGGTSGYSMPLIGGLKYKLSFKYGGWGNSSGSINLSVKDGSNNECYSTSITISKQADNNTEGWTEFSTTFTTTTNGNYTLTLTPTANAAIADLFIITEFGSKGSRFFLYNIKEDQYLAQGSDYGTRAALDDSGLDVSLIAIGADRYKMNTRVYGANHYLFCDNDLKTWVDNGATEWTLQSTGTEGEYYITVNNGGTKYLTSNGKGLKNPLILVTSPAAGKASVWKLKTREDRINELKEMVADGSTTMDATFLIKGANFNRNDSRLDNWYQYYYRNQGEDQFAWKFGEHPWFNMWDAYQPNYIARVTVAKNFEVSQEITDALPGVYTLSAQGFICKNPRERWLIPYFLIEDLTVEGNSVVDGVAGDFSYSRYLTQTQEMRDHNPVDYDWVQSIDVTDDARGFYEDDTYWNELPSIRICGNKIKVGALRTGGSAGCWDNQDAVMATFDNFRLTYRPFVKEDLIEYYDMGEYRTVNLGDGPFEIKDSPEEDADPYYKQMRDSYAAAKIIMEKATPTNDELADACIKTIKADDEYRRLAQVNYWKNYDNTKRFSVISKVHDEFGTGGHTEHKVLTVKNAKADVDNPENIALGFTDDGKSIYPQAFAFDKDNNEVNCFYLRYINGEGAEAWLAADGNNIRSTKEWWTAMKVRVIPQTTQDGDWNIRNRWREEYGQDAWWYNHNLYKTREGNNTYGDLIGVLGSPESAVANKEKIHTTGGAATGDLQKMSFIEADMAPAVPLTIKAVNKFSTLMLPFDRALPASVTAWKVTGIGEGGAITLQEVVPAEGVITIKANIPYIIYAESGMGATNFQSYGQAYTDKTLDDELLTGTFRKYEKNVYTDDDVWVPTGAYVLAANKYDSSLPAQMYRVIESNPVRLAANRAYMRLPSGAGVKDALSFSFDDYTDGVADFLNGEAEIEGFYDVQGKKLPRMQKGVNIIRMTDGSTRKILVK